MMLVVDDYRSHPRPAKLKTALWIYGERGGEPFRLLCCACDVVDAKGFPSLPADAVVRCLHLTGGEAPSGTRVPSSLIAVDQLLPLAYVTYVGMGPDVEVPRERTVDLTVHPPTAPIPERPMSERAIRATLAELRDLAGPERSERGERTSDISGAE